MKQILLAVFFIFLPCVIIAAQETTCPIDTINGQRVYRYKVEKSIGLFRVSKKFGVSQQEIIRLNPDLETRGLRFGETIYIPIVEDNEQSHDKLQVEKKEKNTTPATPIEPAVSAEQTPIVSAEQPSQSDTLLPALPVDTIWPASSPADTTWNISSDSNAIHIALMLPFHAQKTKRDPNTERFMDFYEGVLLALYTMQQSGLHFNLHVYDTEKSVERVHGWIQQGALDSIDAVMGLAYPMQLMCVSEWAKEKQIPVIAPFVDHIEGIETNPYLLQFNSSPKQEAIAMADWLSLRGDSIQCVLVEAAEADIPPTVRYLRQEIATRRIPHTTTTLHNILNDSLSLSIMDSVENILIFNTDKYSNLQVLMPHILRTEGDLTLYSRYSWQKEKIILPQVYTTIFDTDIPMDCTEYEALFQRFFCHEHTTSMPRFDLLGYDLTYELVSFLLGKDNTNGLQSDIHFERVSEEGGYRNTHIHIKHSRP